MDIQSYKRHIDAITTYPPLLLKPQDIDVERRMKTLIKEVVEDIWYKEKAVNISEVIIHLEDAIRLLLKRAYDRSNIHLNVYEHDMLYSVFMR